MKGAGKKVYVYTPIKQEPELMYKIYDEILTNEEDLQRCFAEQAADMPESVITINSLIRMFGSAMAQGSSIDEPEGTRFVTLSDTMRYKIVKDLKKLKGDMVMNGANARDGE